MLVGDQHGVVVVPDLVPEMAEQGAVGLVHRDPQLLAVHVVALGEVEGDHAVVVPGHHLFAAARQQVEHQPALRLRQVAGDRQAELDEFDDQASLRRLGVGVCREPGGVVVGGAGPGQPAREAQTQRVVGLDQPVAPRDVQVVAEPGLIGVDDSGQLGGRVLVTRGPDHHQCAVVQAEAERTVAVQAQRVLERQFLTTLRAREVAHSSISDLFGSIRPRIPTPAIDHTVAEPTEPARAITPGRHPPTPRSPRRWSRCR